MPRSNPTMLSFPPFSGLIRKIILITVALFFVLALLRWIAPAAGAEIFFLGALTPAKVIHGEIWQLVTYSFVSLRVLQVAFDMLSLWFIGAYLEQMYGTRWLAEIYFLSVVGAALTTVAISYTGIFGMRPDFVTYGAMGGIFGLLSAWAVLMGDQKFFMFPLPIAIKAKYLVLVYIVVALAMVVSGPRGFIYIAYLGGALFGYLYVKRAPRRGYFNSASQRAWSFRNAYYRWKRRRAARKFQVYMRKHDRNVQFDNQGRFIDPDEGRSPNDRRWMN